MGVDFLTEKDYILIIKAEEKFLAKLKIRRF
jgi:hypothetical protein